MTNRSFIGQLIAVRERFVRADWTSALNLMFGEDIGHRVLSALFEEGVGGIATAHTDADTLTGETFAALCAVSTACEITVQRILRATDASVALKLGFEIGRHKYGSGTSDD